MNPFRWQKLATDAIDLVERLTDPINLVTPSELASKGRWLRQRAEELKLLACVEMTPWRFAAAPAHIDDKPLTATALREHNERYWKQLVLPGGIVYVEDGVEDLEPEIAAHQDWMVAAGMV